MWLEPVEEEEEPVGRRLRLGRLKMMALVPVLMITMLDVANALKIQDVTFPEYAMLGQTVTLVCDYRLDDKEFVDSVKWYKDGKEFYRILPNAPREQDRTRVFKHSGINLDMKKSGFLKMDMHQLVLQDITLDSSGKYKCQITESKPPFHTEQKERKLNVIIRPESGPEIISLRREYTVDEIIDVICSSKRSYPACQLDFFINDEPVRERFKTRYPLELHPVAASDSPMYTGMLQSSSVNLQYPVGPHGPDELKIKCTAKIGNAYWQSVVETTRIKRLGRMLESRSSAEGTTGFPCIAIVSALILHLLQTS